MIDMRASILAVLGSLAFAGCQSTVFGDVANGDGDTTASADHDPANGDTAAPSDDGGDSSNAGDTGAPLITSASSTWLGMNVDSDLPRNDIILQLVPFDTAAAQTDVSGYPVAGASGTSSTDIGFMLSTGTYKVSYKGTGTLAISGIATLQGSWQTDAASGEHRGSLSITGTYGVYGNFLTLAITNGSGQTVTDIHIYLPGIDYDPPQTFTTQQIAALAPFRAFRFMGWMATNGSTIADWADRTPLTKFGNDPNAPVSVTRMSTSSSSRISRAKTCGSTFQNTRPPPSFRALPSSCSRISTWIALPPPAQPKV